VYGNKQITHKAQNIKGAYQKFIFFALLALLCSTILLCIEGTGKLKDRATRPQDLAFKFSFYVNDF